MGQLPTQSMQYLCCFFAGGVAEINDPGLLGLEEDTDRQIAGSFLSCEKSRAPLF